MNAQNTAMRVAESVLGTSPQNMNAAVRRNVASGANVPRRGPPPGLPTLAKRRANLHSRMVAAPEWTPQRTNLHSRMVAAPEWTPARHRKSRKNSKAGRKSRKNRK